MEIDGKNGYAISYEEYVPDDPKAVIIAMHGFAGDKKSSCIEEIRKMANSKGVGLITFDWPAHGESEASGDDLTITNCLSDLGTVLEYVTKKYPDVKKIAFSTSFGGYMTMLYNSGNRKAFDRIILRSPALRMYNVLTGSILDGEMKTELTENGYISFGYERIMKITEGFVNEIKNNDIFALYGDDILDYVSIIHGTEDDVVPINDSLKFASKHKCHIHKVPGADHRYKKDGELDMVVGIVSDILSECI